MKNRRAAGPGGADGAGRTYLLEAGDARLRDRIVLRAGATAHADRADDVAVDDQRIAAARGDHVVEGREVVEERTLADQPLEHHCRTAIAGGGARLVLRDRDRGELAIVVALEIDELAM